MTSTYSQFLTRLAVHDAVLVTVHATRGSVPREQGAWMAVFDDIIVGTVGGGQLELEAIAHAHGGHYRDAPMVRHALGPALGQCCGGEVHLRYEAVTSVQADELALRLAVARVPVALFGGGHVGRALIHVLQALPMAVTWIDSRDEVFPDAVGENVQCEHSDPVHAAVAGLAPGARVLVMSFSHAEDFDVVVACLRRQRERQDLPYVGLIGSKTKWASFRQRLIVRGFTEAELAHVTSPIGVPGIHDKRPEVIAVAVAAQLLQLP